MRTTDGGNRRRAVAAQGIEPMKTYAGFNSAPSYTRHRVTAAKPSAPATPRDDLAAPAPALGPSAKALICALVLAAACWGAWQGWQWWMTPSLKVIHAAPVDGAAPDEPAPAAPDPNEGRRLALERLRDAVGADRAEWEVLGPKVEAIIRLRRQLGMPGANGLQLGGPMMYQTQMFSRPVSSDGSPSVPERLNDLRSAIQEDELPGEMLRQKVEALRDARRKLEAQLAAAEQDLCAQLKDPHHEAALVAMGILR